MNARTMLCALLFITSSGTAFAREPDILAADALRPGQAAVVRTVFQGDSIETFDAEIVGVLRGGRAGGDLILARATSERVMRSGVAQGMSGSPVYVDGRLIGALSSGWPFSREPIFGITPIAEMLAVLEQPDARDPGAAGPAGADPGTGAGGSEPSGFGPFRWPGPATPDATPPAADPARPPALALPLAAGGLAPEVETMLRDALAPHGFAVTPAGRRSTNGSAAALVPGAACAVDVLRGDLDLSAIGTVTWREGDRVLIFGHPFFGSGAVRLPLSTAEIVTILPSLANSFKLGSPGRTVGTATQDRRPAVAGVIGAGPHLLPLSVTIRHPGLGPQTFRFECIEDRVLMPQLMAAAIANSVAESGGDNATQTVSWELVLHRRGAPAVRLHDVQAGDAPAADAYRALLGPLRFLVANPFERLMLDSVRVGIETRPGRAQWTLREARLVRPRVQPGGTLEVLCELERWRGESSDVVLSVPVPHELPAGRYQLWLGGGSEFSRVEAARLPARYRPTSLADAFQRLAALRASDAVYGALWAKAPEVTRDGDDLPELPASALPLLASDQVRADGVERSEWALVSERRMPVKGVMRGELILDVTVEPEAP